jgi:hypothetical protein
MFAVCVELPLLTLAEIVMFEVPAGVPGFVGVGRPDWGPDWGQTKSYLIETMVELLGSQVLAGKCEFALTAVPIANCCAAVLLGTHLNPLDK